MNAARLAAVAALLASCGDAAQSRDPSRGPTGADDPHIAQFERRSAEDPRDGASRAILAELLWRRAAREGDADARARAVEVADEALRLDPRNGRAAAAGARAIAAEGRAGEALDRCDAFLATTGADVRVLEAAAEIALARGAAEDAERRLDALLARSADGPALRLRAEMIGRRGAHAEAAAAAREAALRADRGGLLPHEIAACHLTAAAESFRAGRPDDARADLREALRADPGNPEAIRMLGSAAGDGR